MGSTSIFNDLIGPLGNLQLNSPAVTETENSTPNSSSQTKDNGEWKIVIECPHKGVTVRLLRHYLGTYRGQEHPARSLAPLMSFFLPVGHQYKILPTRENLSRPYASMLEGMRAQSCIVNPCFIVVTPEIKEFAEQFGGIGEPVAFLAYIFPLVVQWAVLFKDPSGEPHLYDVLLHRHVAMD
ncbi:Protein of unknown function [Pyronema omphalodes CBS 100304]|uniref:Uncharacterized protein n=1 Tax=Pyronema omphalodes (strain CBS 100304) TaxID=1076935 RepID=U4KU05_PYROM|nr:Protein of unknown function [Pyronema omphalodes CBS 100304]